MSKNESFPSAKAKTHKPLSLFEADAVFREMPDKDVAALREAAEDEYDKKKSLLNDAQKITSASKRQIWLSGVLQELAQLPNTGILARKLVEQYKNDFGIEDPSGEEMSSMGTRPINGNGWYVAAYGNSLIFKTFGKADFRTKIEMESADASERQFGLLMQSINHDAIVGRKGLDAFLASNRALADRTVSGDQVPESERSVLYGKDLYDLSSTTLFFYMYKMHQGGFLAKKIIVEGKPLYWIEYLSDAQINNLRERSKDGGDAQSLEKQTAKSRWNFWGIFKK